MPARPTAAVVPDNRIDDIIDIIVIIHRQLDTYRQRLDNASDREAIFSQMTALSKYWRRLDALRLSQVVSTLAPHQDELRQVEGDIRKALSDIKKIAVVIHAAAKAIAIAERVFKLIKP